MKTRFDDYDWKPETLRAWAFETPKSYLPQEFGLVVVAMATIEEARFFLDLAADLSCPKHGFFLACLYKFVGQAFREEFKRVSRQDIGYFVMRAANFATPSVQQWVADVRHLLEEPDGFDTKDWFMGQLANLALERDEPSRLK